MLNPVLTKTRPQDVLVMRVILSGMTFLPLRLWMGIVRCDIVPKFLATGFCVLETLT